ncbi:hypothetical protein [Dawidia soli]|uniref:Uncharacterized protein n=1 Tax=Dawidia soli TaxID=2782352 RepID=A0AAP2GEW7_9BACT|nr:hypothetical protein [Dawidia soli]MBT1688867.1 hypothetical protein [Dawidia soli]
MPKKTVLKQRDIERKVSKRLKKYKKLNYLGQFAMFMGTAQLLEIGLKNLLIARYGYKVEQIEKKTLGWTTAELEKNQLRTDFVKLLKSLVEKRNYVAHELLANEMIKETLLGGLKPKKHYSKDLRFLHKSILEVEQVMVLFNWTSRNDGWS